VFFIVTYAVLPVERALYFVAAAGQDAPGNIDDRLLIIDDQYFPVARDQVYFMIVPLAGDPFIVEPGEVYRKGGADSGF